MIQAHPTMMDPLAYRKNFRASAAMELFYTGGPLALSSDASFVACACTDDIKVVEVETGKVRCFLKGDSELVTALSLSRDGKFLLSASRSLQIRLWDLLATANLRSWKAHEAPVTMMAMDPSGGLLATASADRSVQVWDVDGGFCTHAFRGHKGVVTSILFHPDPNRLLLFSGGDDTMVRVWDLVRKTCVSVLEKHFAVVTSLAVSTDGLNLLTAGRDKVVNVWDLQDYSLETTIPVHEVIETVCVIPDVFNLPGNSLTNLVAHRRPPVQRLSHGGVQFLTVGELGVIRIWDSKSSICLYNQKSADAVSSSLKEESKGGFVHATLIVPGGRVMCVTADQCLLFYESLNGEELKLYKRLIGYNDEIIDLKFVGEDATRLAVATNLEQVRVYDLESMACIQELVGHTDIVLCLDACSTLSGQSLLVSSAKDRMVRLWNVEDATCIGLAAGHMAAVGAVAFSKKRKNFFVARVDKHCMDSLLECLGMYDWDVDEIGCRFKVPHVIIWLPPLYSDCTLKVWSIEALLAGTSTPAPALLSSQAAVVAHDKDINAVAIAPNDSLVCSASQDRTARVWRLPELVHVLTVTGHKRGVWSVEFSPVDQCILTASGDKTIRIWALSDGSCLKVFEGHTASVLKVAFITRGTQIISAGADGLVKLWTIKGNECTNTFDNHEDKIWALAVSTKDERLATGGADSLVNLWTDCTASDKEESFRKEEEEALRVQDLENALKESDYLKAVQLAFELQLPFRLLHVFEDIFRIAEAEFQMQMILKGLGKEHLQLLLQYVRDWNSKSKFCHVAQYVMFNLLHVLPPTGIVKVPGVSELLEGIVPYTQRHFGRIDRLNQSTRLLDFILSSMSYLVPSNDNRLLVDGILPLKFPPLNKVQDITEHLREHINPVEPEVIQTFHQFEHDGVGGERETCLSAEKVKQKGKGNQVLEGIDLGIISSATAVDSRIKDSGDMELRVWKRTKRTS